MMILVNVLNIVIANLANFTIDKGNLIFILSKHYKRSTCLYAKVFALFVFLLFLETFSFLFTSLFNYFVKQKLVLICELMRNFLKIVVDKYFFIQHIVFYFDQ